MNIVKIKEGITYLFDNFSIDYTERGINLMLSEWETNKAGLIEVLRKNPKWNEDELCISEKVTFKRPLHTKEDIMEYCLQDAFYDMLKDRDYFNTLRMVTDMALSCIETMKISEEVAQKMRVFGGKARKGWSISKALNNFYLTLKLDEKLGYSTVNPQKKRYDAFFARLSDMLVISDVEAWYHLSVNPIDYIRMGNDVSSCYGLDGEYARGTTSYMADEYTLIFYASKHDAGLDVNILDRSMVNRNVFVYDYDEKCGIQSRTYGYHVSKNRPIIFDWVLANIDVEATKDTPFYKGGGNYNEPRVSVGYIEGNGDLLYVDFVRSPNYDSFAIKQNGTHRLNYGHLPICPECGEEFDFEGTGMSCGSCSPKYICAECGDEITSRYDIYYDYDGDAYYHCSCVQTCTCCGMVINGCDIDYYKDEVYCLCCFQDEFQYCEKCDEVIRTESAHRHDDGYYYCEDCHKELGELTEQEEQ